MLLTKVKQKLFDFDNKQGDRISFGRVLRIYSSVSLFMMRDVQARSLPKRATDEDKRSRTLMTIEGMKTFRVRPTVNNSALAKYQPRSSSAPVPRAHSTPIPSYEDRKHDDDLLSVKSRQTSSSERSKSPRSEKSSPKAPVLGSTCSSPVQYYTNYKTLDSYHTQTFTPRSLSCTPPHLYMANHIRKAAAQFYRVSSSSSRQTLTSSKTDTKQDDTEIPTRFGKPIYLPSFVKTNPHLRNKELSLGQKQYLWGIARIYSTSHMKTQVQKQYQTLLDHEFKKRLQKMGISEREKVKEMKDYLRYKKFIKNYDQRIPRNLRPKDLTEVRSYDAHHIHRHVIKGWTTDVASRRRYIAKSSETGDSPLEVENQEDCGQTLERGSHIYKHVIKGWTMDPHANDVFHGNPDKEPSTEIINKQSKPKSKGNDKVAFYRVDIARSGGKDTTQDDVLKITRVYKAINPDKMPEKSESIEIFVRSADSNCL